MGRLEARVVGRASSSLLRVAELRTGSGVVVRTPVYAVRVEDLFGSDQRVSVDEVAERRGVVEVNVSSMGNKRLPGMVGRVADAGLAYYVVVKPTLARKAVEGGAEKLLGYLSRLLEPGGYVTVVLPDTLFEARAGPVEDFCAEHSCTYMVSTTKPRTELMESLQRLEDLAGRGVVERGLVAYSCMKANPLSRDRLRALAAIRGRVGEDTLLLVYGAATTKALRTAPRLGLAADLIQYYLGVDMAGPTRSPGGAPGYEPKRRLLLAKRLLYADLDGLGRDEVLRRVLEAAREEYTDIARSVEEAAGLVAAVLEVHNLRARLHYTQLLRSQDPDQLLSSAQSFYQAAGLDEALRELQHAITYVRERTQGQRRIDDYS